MCPCCMPGALRMRRDSRPSCRICSASAARSCAQRAGSRPTTIEAALAPCERALTMSALVRVAWSAQAELKLRDLDMRRGPGGRGGGVIGPGGRGAGLRAGAPDRDARDGGIFDREGLRANGGARDSRLQGRLGAGGGGGDLRGELRRGSDMRGSDLRDARAGGGDLRPGHRIPWDAADARGGAADRPRAPHPWDPTPKATALRDVKPARAVIQSAITKRGREEEEEETVEEPADDDDEVRRRKRGRDNDEEDEDEKAGKGDGDEAEPPSGMRMDMPDAAFDRAAKSRRISAEGDRESDRTRERDRDDRRDERERERERRSDGRRERGARNEKSSGQDAESKVKGEGATVINKVEVKNRNKRMFGGLLGMFMRACVCVCVRIHTNIIYIYVHTHKHDMYICIHMLICIYIHIIYMYVYIYDTCIYIDI